MIVHMCLSVHVLLVASIVARDDSHFSFHIWESHKQGKICWHIHVRVMWLNGWLSNRVLRRVVVTRLNWVNVMSFIIIIIFFLYRR